MYERRTYENMYESTAPFYVCCTKSNMRHQQHKQQQIRTVSALERLLPFDNVADMSAATRGNQEAEGTGQRGMGREEFPRNSRGPFPLVLGVRVGRVCFCRAF